MAYIFRPDYRWNRSMASDNRSMMASLNLFKKMSFTIPINIT